MENMKDFLKTVHHAQHEKIIQLSDLTKVQKQLREFAIELGPSKEGLKVVDLGVEITNIINNVMKSLPEDLRNILTSEQTKIASLHNAEVKDYFDLDEEEICIN